MTQTQTRGYSFIKGVIVLAAVMILLIVIGGGISMYSELSFNIGVIHEDQSNAR